MTTAAMAAYACDQIDQMRAELNGISKSTTYESLESQSRLATLRRALYEPELNGDGC
jgi:hypothetical protein